MEDKKEILGPNGKPICNCGHCQEIKNQVERCRKWREDNELSNSLAYR